MAMSPLSSLLEGSGATPDVPTRQAASIIKQEVAGPVTQSTASTLPYPLGLVTQKYGLYLPLSPRAAPPGPHGLLSLGSPPLLEEGGLSQAADPRGDKVKGSVKRKSEKTQMLPRPQGTL